MVIAPDPLIELTAAVRDVWSVLGGEAPPDDPVPLGGAGVDLERSQSEQVLDERPVSAASLGFRS